MSNIKEILKNKKTCKSVWFMRQAGRYLPEFREIRSQNQNFIDLCLNSELSSKITLQPIKRYDLDSAIIFSDILMVPYALNQKVEFVKDQGPILEEFNFKKFLNNDKISFTQKLHPVYKAIEKTSKDPLMSNRDMIGFVGAPWTILVYMINKSSPKKGLSGEFFKDDFLINRLLGIIEKFLKLHIKNQIEAGAQVIQIFDSWAGLLKDKIPEYIYIPTLNIVDYVKTLGVPVICFPRGIKDYKNFCEVVNPNMVNIDYNVNPEKIKNEIQIPIQGGLDPRALLKSEEKMLKGATKYIEAFKDIPYIFNLGHGLLPETDPDRVEKLIEFYRNYS